MSATVGTGTRITAEALEVIRAHGVETFPDECCGALIDVGGVIVDAFKLPNTTSSGAARRFQISPNDYRMSEAQGVGVEGEPSRASIILIRTIRQRRRRTTSSTPGRISAT